MKRLSVMFLVCLALGLVAVSGCGPGQPLYTPPPPTLAPPTNSAPMSLTVNPTTLTSATTSTAVSPGTTATPGNLPSTTAAVFLVSLDKAEITYPDSITFSLAGSGPQSVASVSLSYGTDKRSLGSETRTATPTFQPGKTLSAKWIWQMKITGSLPPGANIWWKWEITDDSGKTTYTPKQTLSYMDSRYSWQSIATKQIELYWHDQDAEMLGQLTADIETSLSRIQVDVSIPTERKPRVIVYRSSEELRGAVLFTQAWTGALAYPEYNIVLTAINPGILDWAKGALPHEITHLIVGEATFGPFGGLPTWLNEGLAMYVEGDLASYLKQALDKAIEMRSFITLRSLSSSFPTDSSAAYLAYAESQSVVKYLLDTYGWEKMNQLLGFFREGSTNDNALKKVYSLDTDELDARWKTFLGAG